MIKVRCIKDTYTYDDEQHHFLDVEIGDICLFEFYYGIYWFKGYVEKNDENRYLTAKGLSSEHFFEMFEII